MAVRECRVGVCLGLKRYFTWSSPRERSKSRRKWHEGIFLGIKDESEIAGVRTHTEFLSRSIRRVPREDSGDDMLFKSIREEPRGNCNLELKEES